MREQTRRLVNRVEDVLTDSGVTEYDRHVVIQPPAQAPVDETATISLTFGDLQDGTGRRFRQQHLEEFFQPVDAGSKAWYEFAGWVRDNPTAVGEEVKE